MSNGKHRARWLSEMVSEGQRYLAKAREAPEAAQVRQALALLQDARQTALADTKDGDEA